jgi:murein DD-endopeptidase MepM/ murein hydrolase activator NlpD
MKIILLSGGSRKSGSIAISPWWVGGFSVLLLASVFWFSYNLGVGNAEATFQAQATVAPEEGFVLLLDEQRQEWMATKKQTREHLDALALKLGEMQSRLLRLDALGERLTKLGELDPEEFNFKELPPRGGVDLRSSQSMELEEMVKEMDILARTIEDRELKLNVLEDLIMTRELAREIRPSGYPVKKGWISSRYGYRKDPFSGKKMFHRGVDISSKRGSDIVAVASGIVSYSGKKIGFGHTIEIIHGDGFVTRYAHNQENLVKVGDAVSKGQVIAKVGSSGRSTGPHLHFEVSQRGKSLNPQKYLKSVN